MTVTLQSCLARTTLYRASRYSTRLHSYPKTPFSSFLYNPKAHFAAPSLTTKVLSFSSCNKGDVRFCFSGEGDDVLDFFENKHRYTKGLPSAILSSLAGKLAGQENVSIESLNKVISEVLAENKIEEFDLFVTGDDPNAASYVPLFLRLLGATAQLGNPTKLVSSVS